MSEYRSFLMNCDQTRIWLWGQVFIDLSFNPLRLHLLFDALVLMQSSLNPWRFSIDTHLYSMQPCLMPQVSDWIGLLLFQVHHLCLRMNTHLDCLITVPTLAPNSSVEHLWLVFLLHLVGFVTAIAIAYLYHSLLQCH